MLISFGSRCSHNIDWSLQINSGFHISLFIFVLLFGVKYIISRKMRMYLNKKKKKSVQFHFSAFYFFCILLILQKLSTVHFFTIKSLISCHVMYTHLMCMALLPLILKKLLSEILIYLFKYKNEILISVQSAAEFPWKVAFSHCIFQN